MYLFPNGLGLNPLANNLLFRHVVLPLKVVNPEVDGFPFLTLLGGSFFDITFDFTEFHRPVA